MSVHKRVTLWDDGGQARETRNGGPAGSPAKEKTRRLFGVAILHAYVSYKKLNIIAVV